MENTQPEPIGSHKLNIAIGCLGLLVAAYGNLLVQGHPFQKWCYLIGGLLLFLSSILERQTFFTILQFVLSAGAAISFATLSPPLKAAVPITLTVIAIIYFTARGELKDKVLILGCVGLALLALGYAVSNPLINLSGAVALTIFSYLSFRRGIDIALIWTILNVVFTITSAIASYRFLFS